MGVYDTYGLKGSDPNPSEPEPDETEDSEPTPESSEPRAETGEYSTSTAPSATTVASSEIDRLLITHRPISSAVHFNATDSALSPKASRKRSKGGRFFSLLTHNSGPGKTSGKAPSADTTEADPADPAEPAARAAKGHDADSEEATDAPKERQPLLRTKHLVVGGIGLAVVLVCGLAIGLVTATSNVAPAPAPDRSPDAASAEPEEDAAQQRDRPLQLSMEPPVCWTPSTNVENAIKREEDKAFTCTPAWNADGTRVVIHLTGGPYKIAKVCMIPGWDFTGPDRIDQWFQYRSVSIATWRFDGTSKSYDQKFDGSREVQCKSIEDEVYTSTVTLQITKTIVPKGGSAPETTSATAVPGFPGMPGGWGSINLPNMESGQPSAGQTSGEPKAFALSFLQIFGHKPS